MVIGIWKLNLTFLEKSLLGHNVASFFSVLLYVVCPEFCTFRSWRILVYNLLYLKYFVSFCYQKYVNQFSHSVIFDSLWPHGLQHARLPCPSPTPRAYSNSCQSSQWCYPTISSSVIPFSSCLQSFPVSGSSLMSQRFAWGGQSIGVSASTSILPVNIQDWFPLGWTGWISLQSKGLSRVFSNTTVQKHQLLCILMKIHGKYFHF